MPDLPDPIASSVFTDGELTNAVKWYTRIFQVINAIITWLNANDGAAGQVTITPSGVNVITSEDIVFPAGKFNTPPKVVCGLASGLSSTTTCFVWPTSITADGFTANVNRSSTTSTTIHWIARSNG